MFEKALKTVGFIEIGFFGCAALAAVEQPIVRIDVVIRGEIGVICRPQNSRKNRGGSNVIPPWKNGTEWLWMRLQALAFAVFLVVIVLCTALAVLRQPLFYDGVMVVVMTVIRRHVGGQLVDIGLGLPR